MLFVMISIILFSIPGILFLWSIIDVRSGRKERVMWKLPAILLLLLLLISGTIQYYYLRSYGFPLIQTSLETWIGLGIAGLILGIILLINFITTTTMGKNLSKTVHDPKMINGFAVCIAFFVLITLFFAAPTGKKVAFAYSINEAMEATDRAQTNEVFPVVLVSSERDCLSRTANCRNSAYSNQFFIKNNGDTIQEVQVKMRALNSSDEEMKVIDSEFLTLQPGELRLIETEETYEDSSIWNQFSFQTDYRIANFQYKLRHR